MNLVAARLTKGLPKGPGLWGFALDCPGMGVLSNVAALRNPCGENTQSRPKHVTGETGSAWRPKWAEYRSGGGTLFTSCPTLVFPSGKTAAS